MKQALCSALLFLFLSLPLSTQPSISFPVDVLNGLQSGDISATHTQLDIGTIEQAFDGILGPNNVARSAGISPMVVTLSFKYPFNITQTGIYTDNVESGVWTVESAGTLADLNAKTGSYQKLVDQAPYSLQNHVIRSVSGSGKLLRLTMWRQTGDQYVHLGEWSISATANITVSSICMNPNRVRLIPNSNFQPNFYAVDASGNEFPISSGLVFSSSNLNVVSVNPVGVLASPGTLGEANISATWQGVNFQTKVRVVPDFVSTPAPKRVIKVALVIIDPQIPTAGGQRFSERFWSYNGGPMALTQQVRDSLYAVSGGTIEIQIAETHWETDLALNRFGGSILSVDSMYRLFLEPDWNTLHTVAEQTPGGSVFQYNDLLNKYDFCSKSNAKQIDEIWVWAMPFIGMYESNMAGTGAFWINGPVIQGNSCTDLVAIMGFNYERYAGCALHNYTHRIELTMAKVYDTYYHYSPTDPPYPAGHVKDPWQLYQNYDALAGETGQAHIGNGHFPANGVQNYDYANLHFVPSHVPNWKRYPLLFDQTKQVNCTEWGCEGDCGLNYCSYFLRHLPHFKCKDKYGRLNNWWTYIFDYNEGKALEAQTSDCDCQMFDDTPQPPCVSKGDFPWHEWIAGVKVGGILDNPSGKSQYSDFTNKVIDVYPGHNYPITVTVGFSYYTYDEYLYAWLDSDKNGIFENTEALGSFILPRPPDGTPTAQQYVGTIYVPFDATPVDGMRLRISVKRGEYPTQCEVIQYGEVEDYTVNIKSAVPKPDLLTVAWEVIPSWRCQTPPGSQFSYFGGLVRNPVPNASAGPFKVKTYFSKDDTLSVNDLLWQTDDYPGIGPNTVLSLSLNSPVPSTLPPGWYYVLTVTDVENAVDEFDETNNIATHRVLIGAPDFILQNLSTLPAEVKGGENLSFSVQVKNIASFPMQELTGSFSILSYLSTDLVFGDANDIVMSYTSVNVSEFVSTSTVTTNITFQVPGALAPGVYYLMLTFSYCELNWRNNDLIGPPIKITQGAPGQYCTSKSSFPWHEWISKVKIGTVEKLSGKSAYSDFTSTVFQITSNTSIPVELQATYSYYTFDQYWCAWIDFNKNGVFEEPGERIFEGVMQRPADGSGATQDYKRWFSFPSNHPAGTTRMRVSMKRGAYPSPCEILPFGEVEDYTVNLIHINHDCQLSIDVQEVTCSDNNTSTNPDDDTYSVKIAVNATGTVSTWVSNFYRAAYGVPVVMGPFYIKSYPKAFIFVWDANDYGCTAEATVVAPQPCSTQSKPDLTFVNAGVTPPAVKASAAFKLNFEVKNTGDASAGPSRATWHLSTDAVLDANDKTLGGVNMGSLATGVSQVASHQVVVPGSTIAGSYYIILRTDADNTVVESNENNNTKFIPITINSGGGGTPDCDAIKISATPGSITIENATAPHVLIKVWHPGWTIAYQCLDNCANPLIVSGLGSGSHFVEIKLIDAQWKEICRKTQTIVVNSINDNGELTRAMPKNRFILAFDNFYPNPAKYWLNFDLFAPAKQQATILFFDQLGRQVHTMPVQLEEGVNSLVLQVSDWKSGMYSVIAFGADGLSTKGRFLKVWEE